MAAAWLAGATGANALELHAGRSAATDLEVTGRLIGVPVGETKFVRWAELRALPTTKLRLEGEFVKGEQDVTAVFLDDIWKNLPRGKGADVVLATCRDGYAAVFREAQMPVHRPFLVLEINGVGPEKWPPPGLKFNPAPYVISVSATVAPDVAKLTDPGHKKPWGVTRIEIASYAERFGEVLQGRWEKLSAAGVEGREIWINSCASCHQGPGAIFGGTKSGRPFPMIEALAGYSPEVFRAYVRKPKSVWADAKMEPHPHYTDAQLEGLIVFITAGRVR